MPTLALVGGTHIHTPNFVKALAEAPDVTVAYVYDDDADTATRRQEVCGGRVVESIEPILADDAVDAVVVCSETSKHLAYVEAIAGAGKHLFVEKPLGMGAADAAQMARLIEEAGVIFQTGFFMRSQPEVRFVRELVQAGTLGKINRVRASNCHAGAIGGWFDTEWRWMADVERAGCGAFGDLGAHVLDVMLWIMEGDAVERCTGVIGSAIDKYGCDEFGEGLIRFASGAAGVLAGGWVDHANPNRFEISGTKGHASLGADGLRITCPDLEGADGQGAFEVPQKPWPHAFVLFLDAMRGKDVSLVTAKEAAYRNAVMEAIYTGAANGTWVPPAV